VNFEFATATRIIFGSKVFTKTGSLAAELGSHILAVTGSVTERSNRLIEQLRGSGVEIDQFSVKGEPTVDVVNNGINFIREMRCDVVVAFGGGSVLDAGKAIAAMANNPGDLYDYLEVIGEGKKLIHPSLPFIAIPTTAGTGTEVTRNAVIGSPRHGVKVSLRSAYMLPRIALVDPELTIDLPPHVTAFTGMDALTQLIEPYTSKMPNPMIDMISLEGVRRISHSLLRVYLDGSDLDSRANMALASMYSGISLANAPLGAVHGFAGPIGGMLSAPHGVICARLLPLVMEINIKALENGRGDHSRLRRYEAIATALTHKRNAKAMDGVKWVYQIREKLKIPPLGDFGMTEAQIQELVDKSSRASSMKGNPVQLTTEEMASILRKAI
jgi:alcohol dehydrogenase class IV